MTEATLTRKKDISGPAGTFGVLEADNGFKCMTCENTGLLTPVGTYTCELRYSAKHRDVDLGYGKGMVYGLKDVPGRTDIELHPANWAFQLLGCIAPGAAVADIPAPARDNQPVRGVTSSRAACKALMAAMHGRAFRLKIVEEA